MVEKTDEVTLILQRRLASKSRPVPAMLCYGVQEEGKTEAVYDYQVQLYSDPSEDLLESYIATVARGVLRYRDSIWDTASSYEVEVALGRVAGAGNADIDNIIKLIFDGLTGVLWDADSQVDACSVRRRQGIGRRTPTTVKVTRIFDA